MGLRTRAAAFAAVLVIHAVFFALFAALRVPLRQAAEDATASIAFFLPESAPGIPSEGGKLRGLPIRQQSKPRAPVTRAPIPGPAAPAIVNPIPATAAPDWHLQAESAAAHAIEEQERRRQHPSPLEPHDFSGVKSGATDSNKPQFGWAYAATHRVEEIPTGGLIFNITDRCSIVWVIVPLALCKIGKLQGHSDLFQHLEDPLVLGESKEP